MAKRVKKTIVAILFMLMLLYVSCGSARSIETATVAPLTPSPTKEVVFYRYYTDIPTYTTVVLAVTLGKGEKFEGRLEIWKAYRSKLINPYQIGAVIFWVRTASGTTILDAGRIEGEYELSFTAEASGDYWFIFDDRAEECLVRMHHNSPAPLRDITGMY